MLNQQPVESKDHVGQVCKPPAQSLHLLVILTILGVPKPRTVREEGFTISADRPSMLSASVAAALPTLPNGSCRAKEAANLRSAV
jgi:hypothetical protein